MGDLPKIRSFRDLEIWKRGINLVQKVYELSGSFPKEELYGLTGQMRRAGVSIPSNTARVLLGGIMPNIGSFCTFRLGVVRS